MNRRGTEPYARWCGRTAGAIPPPTRFKEPQIIVHEADQPDLVVDFADAHQLAGKHRAETAFADPIVLV